CNSSATAPNGAIDLEVNNIIPPVSYLWEHGPTTQDVSNLSHLEDYMVTITDGNGCERDSTFTIQNCIGLEEETAESKDKLSIYPNPIASGTMLSIVYDNQAKAETVEIQIIDLLGQVVLQKQIQTNSEALNYQLATSNLSKGSYFVYLMANDQKKVSSFVIQ
ncbi:MAG: hypothetical protein ACI8ZO_000945, partial [Flavobacteriales bacterium]